MLDLDAFLDLQDPALPKFSPDGKHVIYTAALFNDQKKGEHRVSSIWLAQVGEEKSARQLTSGLFNDVSPEWSPDSLSIAFVSDRAKPGKSSAIYQLSLSGGEAFALTPTDNEQTINSLAWSPDGNYIAYDSADEKSTERKAKDEAKDDAFVYGEHWDYSRIRLLHVATRHIETLFAEKAHVMCLTWNQAGSAIAFTTSKTPEINSGFADGTKLQSIDIVSKDITTIYDGPKIFRCTELAPLIWIGDDIYFIAGASPTKANTSLCLHKTSMKGGQEWTRLAGGQDNCVTACLKPVGGTDIIMRVSEGLKDHIRTLDGTNLHTSDSQIRGFHGIRRDDGLLLAIVTGTTNKPQEVYNVNSSSTTSSSKLQLSNHGAWLSHPIGNERPVSIPTYDETTTVDGIFLTPPNSSKKPHPTVVIIHGGPYSRVTSTFTPEYAWSTMLLSQNYAVLHPNYRGGQGRGESIASCARNGVGTVEYDDIISHITHLIDSGDIDPSRIVVGGWSQGGFLSYLCTVRNGAHPLQMRKGKEWRFCGAICGAGVSFWNGMAMNSDMPSFECELLGSIPWDQDRFDCEGDRRASAMFEMRAAGREGRLCECLILHGEQDERVPIDQARGFARGLRHWKVAVEEVRYPREEHLIKERAHIKDILGRVSRFCDQHLK